nr:Wzy polymerase domain-containing protein [Echinimonas agarilytica]
MASFLVVSVVAAFIKPLNFGSSIPSTTQRLSDFIAKIVLVGASFTLIVLLSRTALLSLVLSLMLVAFVAWRTGSDKKKQLFSGLLLIILGGILGVIYNDFQESIRREVESSLVSGGVRLVIWPIVWDMFLEHWLFGIGYGNFEVAYLNFQAELYQQNGDYGLSKLSHPHNEILFWAVEGGILPCVGILSFAIFVIWRLCVLGARGAYLAALMLPLVLHSLTEYPFYASAFHWLLLCSLLGFLEVFYHHQNFQHMRIVNVSFVNAWNGVALSLSSLLVIFCLTNLWTIRQVTETVKMPVETRTLEPLQSIVNPYVMQYQLEYMIMHYTLPIYLKESNKQGLLQYVEWAQGAMKRKPRVELLINMIRSYTVLQMHSEATATIQHMKYLYPNAKL